MATLATTNRRRCGDNPTRRDFLRAGSLAAGTGLVDLSGAKSTDRR
jgi:hypothetical protein